MRTMLSFKDKNQLLTVKQSIDQTYFQSILMAGKGWEQEARLPWAYLTRASLSLLIQKNVLYVWICDYFIKINKEFDWLLHMQNYPMNDER